MADIEMEDIEIGQPRQLTDRQMSSLVSLWRLSHYRQAPLSSWTMLYTQRRPKRKSPMICFDTKMYKLLREQQAEDMKKKQAHQHQIWQHVQDRLAEHNQILEQEKAEESKKARRQQQKEAVEAAATMDEEDNEDTAAPIITEDDSSTVTSSASTSPESTPAKKRSIRWGLQNNQTKRFDKTLPITLVKVPSVDTRPTKSALKVRTLHTIQSNKQQHASKKSSTTTNTDTKKSPSASSTPVSVRKHAVDFF
ncbi:hypothetical protein F5H01DRAFT_330017 [Linnemannia elongata]|uniref:Uncharacterized protein n=1 Tax=Linnemannia elongata AG-77 TaxID=1314771 RepID=A0A197JGK0_9FUNG|nr:hypothetical protein F5H01DRAFT_330017 [Linnemannia elongata]OAQ23631.1 hypothetical protein K457DRAFT_1910903 [Linnemannia elongata AG-77]